MKHVKLVHGNGGVYSEKLIKETILKNLGSAGQNNMGDSAGIISGDYGFTTDSFVIYPRKFPGGDIGKLSVCGTVNDLIMGGYEPKYISLALIIEEGFSIEELEEIISSIRSECEACRIDVVTGDTKVVERGCAGGGIFINTTGVGKKIRGIEVGTGKIEENDNIIVTGDIGDHGVSILCEREGLFKGQVKSDCRALIELIPLLREYSDCIKFLRDPTRGGLATTLNEMIGDVDLTAVIFEEDIPLDKKVTGACEVLGLDPMYSANEGKAVIVVKDYAAKEVLYKLKRHEVFNKASIIGKVEKAPNLNGKVVVRTKIGGTRVLSKLVRDIMPRIC